MEKRGGEGKRKLCIYEKRAIVRVHVKRDKNAMTRNYATCIPSHLPVSPFRFLRLSGRVARTFDASFRPPSSPLMRERGSRRTYGRVSFFFFFSSSSLSPSLRSFSLRACTRVLESTSLVTRLNAFHFWKHCTRGFQVTRGYKYDCTSCTVTVLRIPRSNTLMMLLYIYLYI